MSGRELSFSDFQGPDKHRWMQQLTRFNEHIRSKKIRSSVEERLPLERLKDRKDVKRLTTTNPYVSQRKINRKPATPGRVPRISGQSPRCDPENGPAVNRSGFQKLPY